MLTRKQAEWVDRVLGVDADVPTVDDDAANDQATNGADASAGDNDGSADGGDGSADSGPDGLQAKSGLADGADKVAIAPVIPVVVFVAKTLTGELTCNVTIVNNTNFTLTLDTSSLNFPHGELKTGQPKGILKPNGDSTNFTAHSIGVDLKILNVSATPVEGTIRYFVGDSGTVWSCHFNNPRTLTDPLGTNSADSNVTGPNAAGLQQPFAKKPNSGSDAVYLFTLDGKGGPQPPGPDPSGGGGVLATCRVKVVNDSKQTIFLRKQDKAQGDYVTDPAKTLAPGASTDFVYTQTPNSTNPGCRGTLSWDIGDPKVGSWGLMWDNQKGAKNLSASFLTPDDGTFHSLDQIDDGDENVPATFTLSGGGQGPQPGAKPTSCAIQVKNATSGPLKLSSSQAISGTFQSKPPATIAAGDTALITFAGATDDPSKGAKGSMSWDAGDPKAATWTTSWDNPPGAKNTVDGEVDPADGNFESSAETADGDDNVAMSFVLGGGAEPPADDDFSPPPKSKQPTLRKGDESPDGWVEYAQRLLKKNKLRDDITGVFDKAMQDQVKAFQKKAGCQVDGVIGNETWSMLREGPKEAVGTDKRAPHSFEEKDAQARFVTEQTDSTGYVPNEDRYFMRIVSTGEQPIDKFFCTLKVTQPDGTSHAHKIAIGEAKFPTPDGQGNFHIVEFKPFKQIFKLKDGVDPLKCTADAYLDEAIGGDRFTGPVE